MEGRRLVKEVMFGEMKEKTKTERPKREWLDDVHVGLKAGLVLKHVLPKGINGVAYLGNIGYILKM